MSLELWIEALKPKVMEFAMILLNEPAHLIVEGVLLVFVVYLLSKSSYRIPKDRPSPLTEKVRFDFFHRSMKATKESLLARFEHFFLIKSNKICSLAWLFNKNGNIIFSEIFFAAPTTEKIKTCNILNFFAPAGLFMLHSY